jgi:uncharacterized protein DUF732
LRFDLGVMMMFARHDIAKLVGTGIAVAALSLTTPGSAAADATDDAFLHKLFDDAVNFSDPAQSIQRARTVCEAFASGMSPAEVHELTLNHSAFSPRQAAIFMADAVQSYCPGYAEQFIS